LLPLPPSIDATAAPAPSTKASAALPPTRPGTPRRSSCRCRRSRCRRCCP
jgi:hypothetical protein